VDFSRVREASGGDRDFEQEIFALYLDDTAAHLAAIAERLDGADFDAVRAHAHTVKGASGNIGAGRMHELARELEARAKNGDCDAVRGLADALDAEFAAVQEFLRRSISVS
jgi:HPt (histidine-containing phosphotransfer) domain-containing protein